MKFILEGYDHLGLTIIKDGKEPEIEILTFPTEISLLKEILSSTFPDLELKVLSEPEDNRGQAHKR